MAAELVSQAWVSRRLTRQGASFVTQANPTALLRQTHIDTIHALFADPPSLRAVAQASAQAHLDEHFAARTLAVEQLYLRKIGRAHV